MASEHDLSKDERELYFAWKLAREAVSAGIAEEVAEQTGLSDADTAILIRLDVAAAPLRQARLAEGLGWDRTRLSHQLTRMATRDLVSRTKVAGGVDISLTTAGKQAIDIARPIHAKAVRHHLLTPLGDDAEAFRRVLGRLGSITDQGHGRGDSGTE